MKLIQFLIFNFLLVATASGNDIEKLNGNWYSYKWKYGYTMENGKGKATITNSPNFSKGQEIVKLTGKYSPLK